MQPGLSSVIIVVQQKLEEEESTGFEWCCVLQFPSLKHNGKKLGDA